MAYTPRDKDTDDRYQFRPDNSTISQLVQPSDDRQNPDNPYESRKRTGDNQYTATDERRNSRSEYTRRVVPTADVLVDPYRRPTHGNARTCVMEINIAVSLGADRNPQASIISSNFSSKPPVIRSTAHIDDVHYVGLDFQSPQNTAQLSTDGIIRPSSSSRNSLGFQQKDTNE